VILKRVFDATTSIFALIVLFPVLVIIALIVRLESPGPAIFRQIRIGRYGRPFVMYKYRTMADCSSEFGPRVTVSGDSRVTRFGRFLRRYKVDELPQLLNVFKGDMSLVGPRPEVEEFVLHYPGDIKDKILSIRPGITDNASVAFRDEETLLATSPDPIQLYVQDILPAKLALYLDYIDRRSMIVDLQIILSTFAAIFRPDRSHAGFMH
jgi:lipopolysaccharide/colanic/teichoic acid biosynthesis glycosyltransferase